MAIGLNKTTFGARSVERTEERKTAQFWLNFGYFVYEGTENEKFVSLPVGIPLDTMEKLKTNSSNHEFAQFQAARNDLHEQILDLAKDLQPGEMHIIRTEGDFAIQIRRVNEAHEAPKTDDSNPYARPKLFAVG